jgi:hypothetical protein
MSDILNFSVSIDFHRFHITLAHVNKFNPHIRKLIPVTQNNATLLASIDCRLSVERIEYGGKQISMPLLYLEKQYDRMHSKEAPLRPLTQASQSNSTE